MFRLENLVYEYTGGRRALDGVSLQVPKGQWLAVLGANGSGKSTLARHLNGLLQPTAGRVWVAGRPLEEYADIQQLRRLVGIVFQNPDNQIVGNSVEEDVAFGLENLGVPRPEMRRRIGEALQMVGLAGREKVDPAALSGGQKQRLAIAGALAMQPQALLLDEATSMLDPVGVAEVLEVLRRLHQQGLTIVMITHNMSEVLFCDQAVVLAAGRVQLPPMPPAELFAHTQELARWHIELPAVTQLGCLLGVEGCLSLPDLLAAMEQKPANVVNAKI